MTSAIKMPASIDDVQKILREQHYISDRSLAVPIFLSLKLQRPLFLEGEAGVGKTEIARALASKPTFMLLDEPFAGVDPIAVADIQALVRHLTHRGIGVLITDHNVRETLGLIDRAYIMHAGAVLTHGSPQEIVDNPDVRRLYLGDRFSF